MQAIIALTVFITVFALMVAAFRHLTGSRQAVRDRIEKYVELAPPAASRAGVANTADPKLANWRAAIRWISQFFESSQWTRPMEHRLIQAGLPLRGAEFIVVCLITVLVAGIILFALSGGKWYMGLVGGLAGYFGPTIFLKLKIKQRAKAFNLQLGDALTLVANSLRTGYSFLQAIELVSREMLPPISAEFARMLKEMNLGVTTEEAMNNLAKRIDSDDLDLVVTSVLIQRQVGGNLAEVLDNIAVTIRERIRLKGEIRTLTAQGRMSGIIIGLLPFAMGGALYMINPVYLSVLFTHPLGHLLLGMSAFGMVAAVIWIRNIVNIEL